MLVRMCRRVLKFEMRTLAASRWREVFALDAGDLESAFAIIM
ncbi:hypothetical protein B0G75_103591 [Paraburkholderia sp. BL18I3N2]|nr:hypothetical protein B0G75_103591 [Paraburkholderia sp. BL18I3N2]